jgi:beta-mannosidase
MTAPFYGEFGLASVPVKESVARYLPDDEIDRMPPLADGAFAYHTPVFNHAEDISRLSQYAGYFVPENCTLDQFVIGSQLSQAVALRHPLERARTRWPHCGGALYYKMNDNFPAASWATADWYGAPKIAYYWVQDAFAPLHACMLFSRTDYNGTPICPHKEPIWLLDDTGRLAGKEWRVVAQAHDGEFNEVARSEYEGEGSVDGKRRLDGLDIDQSVTRKAVPLLVVLDVWCGGTLEDRTFYILNFEHSPGCLFRLPGTSLAFEAGDGSARVTNTGEYPAVAVAVTRPGHLDTFSVSDGYFWLDPGETKVVGVNCVDGLSGEAWNG